VVLWCCRVVLKLCGVVVLSGGVEVVWCCGAVRWCWGCVVLWCCQVVLKLCGAVRWCWSCVVLWCCQMMLRLCGVVVLSGGVEVVWCCGAVRWCWSCVVLWCAIRWSSIISERLTSMSQSWELMIQTSAKQRTTSYVCVHFDSVLLCSALFGTDALLKQISFRHQTSPIATLWWFSLHMCPVGVAFAYQVVGNYDVIHKTGNT